MWKGLAEGREDPFIIKLMPEKHSEMIWREFYMYGVVLKERSLVGCSKDLPETGSHMLETT